MHLAHELKSVDILFSVLLLFTNFVGVSQVAELDGAPRMGPTFGAMFMSGQKAAHCAINSLNRQNALQQQPESADAQKELVNA